MRITFSLLLLIVSIQVNAQKEKDGFFYQSDTTYSHKLSIKVEDSENSHLTITHKHRKLYIDFEFSEMYEEMEINKDVTIEIWRNNQLIKSIKSEDRMISSCGLLSNDSLWVGVDYTLKNPWLEFKSKKFSAEKHFIIDDIKNYL